MMECGRYFIEFDRTGFPLVRRRDWDFAISLFPVSKYQFERFMVEHGPKGNLYTDKWYRGLLEVSPRRPWRGCEERQWELFLTGVVHVELRPFLRFLGSDFRLPEVKEWQTLLQSSADIQEMGIQLKELCEGKTAPPVSLWFEEGLFPLVEEGLLEMVLDNDGERCIGRPFQGLLPNTWSPEIVRDVNWNLCRRAVGFRVVMRR